MKRKVLTFVMRILRYVIKAIVESLRRDMGNKRGTMGKES